MLSGPRLRIAQTLGTPLRSDAARSVVGSLAASGSLQLIVIVSGVLVARSLGPEDRGYLSLLIVISAVSALVGTLGLPSAVTYYIARDPSQARRIVSSLAWVGVLQVGAVFVLQAAALAALVASDPSHVRVAAAISLLLPPGILALSFGCAILQGQRRFTAFNLLRVLPSTAYVAGVVVVYMLDATSLVLFMALWAAVNLIGGLLAVAFAVRGLPKHAGEDAGPSRGEMVRFGLKALLGTLSPVDSVRLDQAVVGLFLSPVALGLYVAAQAFTTLPRIVASSIGSVAYPHVAAELDRDTARRAMWKFFFLGLGLSTLVVAVLELVAGDLIPLFFGEDFTDATATAQILLLASLFVAARRVLTDGVNGLGYPSHGTIAEVASWIVLLPGLAILLPRFGAEGVALALAHLLGSEPPPSDTSCSCRRSHSRGVAGEVDGSKASSGRLSATPPGSTGVRLGGSCPPRACSSGWPWRSFRRSLLGWSSRSRPDSSSPLGAEHSPNTLDHSSNAWPLVATRRRELIRSRMTGPVQDSTFRGASTMAASCCSA